MVKCKDCKQEMTEAESCTIQFIIIDEKTYRRNNKYFDSGDRCHDCGIINKKGNYHHPGCDMERCPKCKGQLISCGCEKIKFMYVEPKMEKTKWQK